MTKRNEAILRQYVSELLKEGFLEDMGFTYTSPEYLAKKAKLGWQKFKSFFKGDATTWIQEWIEETEDRSDIEIPDDTREKIEKYAQNIIPKILEKASSKEKARSKFESAMRSKFSSEIRRLESMAEDNNSPDQWFDDWIEKSERDYGKLPQGFKNKAMSKSESLVSQILPKFGDDFISGKELHDRKMTTEFQSELKKIRSDIENIK